MIIIGASFRIRMTRNEVTDIIIRNTPRKQIPFSMVWWEGNKCYGMEDNQARPINFQYGGMVVEIVDFVDTDCNYFEHSEYHEYEINRND